MAQVTLNSQWGGRVVEAAWERLCTAAGRLDEWRTVLQKAEESVRHYIRESTVPTLEDRLNGREEWPPVPDSSNSAIASTSVAVLAVDGGYLGQRIQEALLANRQPMRAGRGRASTRDLPSSTNGYTCLWTRGGSACTTTYPVSSRG